MSLYDMPSFFYKMWYNNSVKSHLSEEIKFVVARRISDLTLDFPIWTDTETNFIEKFPELKPYSSSGKISGLQLVTVMEEIVNEIKPHIGDLIKNGKNL